MKRSSRKSRTIIEAGTCSQGRVWVGVPTDCYDEVKRTGGTMHIVILTPNEAEAIIEMLQENIEIVRNVDHIDISKSCRVGRKKKKRGSHG